MAARWFIGLSLGPSLSGIDAAVVELTGQGVDLQARLAYSLHEPLVRELRELLINVSTPEAADVQQVSVADHALGEALATTARLAADRASVSLQSVFAIGSTGFVAWHDATGRAPATLALGTAARIAERTGVTVVDDFRSRDVAAGGQGSPLHAIVDQLLLSDLREHRLVIHLGGIARVTYLPPGAAPGALLAWEAGPCNVLLDALMQGLSNGKERLDVGGRWGVQGRQLLELLTRWQKHPFLLRRPPRSLHRSSFAEEFVRQTLVLAEQQHWNARDLLCTATHFIAHAIDDSIRKWLPKTIHPERIILTGGGVKNGFLWRLLSERLAPLPLERSDVHGMAAEAKSAVDAAVLAALTLDGMAGNVPGATGAQGARLLGRLTPGSPAAWSRCVHWMALGRDPLDDE